MGLIQAFINPAGFAAGMVQDKLEDKLATQLGEKISGRSAFLDSVMEKTGHIQGLKGKAAEHIQEATGMTDLRERIMSEVEGIKSRELPPGAEDGILDRKKFLGISASEWMARLGAGLTGAGGGNGQAVYANYLNKEAAKDARRNSRQRAIEARDDDMMGALEGLDTRITQAATSAAGIESSAATALEGKVMDAQRSVMEQESYDARQLNDIRANMDAQREANRFRIEEMDHGASLSREQVEHAAALESRNQMTGAVRALGLNPVSMESTINKASLGDYDSMTPQEQTRLRMWDEVSKARTDEERRSAIMSSISNVMGTRIHARDENTGQDLYDMQGNPIMTNLADAGSAMKYVLGDPQAAADTLMADPIQAEVDGARRFFEQSGTVQPSPMHQKGHTSQFRDEVMSGLPTTRDGVKEQTGAPSGEAIRQQEANLGPIFDSVVADLEGGQTMAQVVGQMMKGGLQPEIVQDVMRKSMEYGYWDGQEDLDRIQVLLQMSPHAHPSAYK
jgi:hypothetical protein